MAEFMESLGFERGSNFPAIYYFIDCDLLVMTYVDDCIVDGTPEDVEWFLRELQERFQCKDTEYITPESPVDYLGIDVSMDDERIYMCMLSYIDNAIKALNITPSKRMVSTPISDPIDTDSPLLDKYGIKQFLTALGMLGWLAQTVRCDVAYAFSRIGQHSAQPTVSALNAVIRVFKYLLQTKDLAISAKLHDPERDITDKLSNLQLDEKPQFRFYTDTDHAGNREPQNKRRLQNGLVVTLRGAPVKWYSKAKSSCTASHRLDEAHADVSSAAAEIYGAGNATMDIMGFGYMVEEMGLPFTWPVTLEMDNEAARIFTEGGAMKTKLKHIDCRQEWVKALREKEVIIPQHVSTDDNLADIFTKILPAHRFIELRDQLMVTRPTTEAERAKKN